VVRSETILPQNLTRPTEPRGGGSAAPGRLNFDPRRVETRLRSKVGNLRLIRGDVIRIDRL
jgi:hypothetical protein